MRLPIVMLLTAVVAIGGASQAVAAPKKSKCTSGACAKKRAKKLLSGRVFIRFTDTGSAGFPSSLDQRLHLCGDSSFVYDSVSYIPGIEPDLDQVIRVTGSWKVLSASMNASGKRGKAKVKGTPDDGSAPVTVKITWNPSKAQIDGGDVIVQQSDLC